MPAVPPPYRQLTSPPNWAKGGMVVLWIQKEYEPSPAVIRTYCLKIQSGWSEYERLSRAGLNDGDGISVFAWTVPAVRVRRDVSAGFCLSVRPACRIMRGVSHTWRQIDVVNPVGRFARSAKHSLAGKSEMVKLAGCGADDEGAVVVANSRLKFPSNHPAEARRSQLMQDISTRYTLLQSMFAFFES